MARNTATPKALILAALLAFAACDAANMPSPIPANRVGTSVSTPTNTIESVTAAPQVEPDYIPRTEELIGLGEAETEGYFGEPSLRRTDQGAQIWQYQADECVLFLFFYPDEDETPRVSYVTSSGARAGQASPGDQACVDAVTRLAVNAGAVTG